MACSVVRRRRTLRPSPVADSRALLPMRPWQRLGRVRPRLHGDGGNLWLQPAAAHVANGDLLLNRRRPRRTAHPSAPRPNGLAPAETIQMPRCARGAWRRGEGCHNHALTAAAASELAASLAAASEPAASLAAIAFCERLTIHTHRMNESLNRSVFCASAVSSLVVYFATALHSTLTQSVHSERGNS